MGAGLTVLRTRPTRTFLKSLQKLDRKGRDRVLAAVQKFQANQSLPSLNLEKLSGKPDRWTIRVDGGDRILLTKAEDVDGAFWILHDFGPHDSYRRW